MNDQLLKKYKNFKIELQTCKIGGLFLALYDDANIVDHIIDKLETDLPNYFIFPLTINKQKIDFPSFFQNTFAQMGKQSNIFHILGLDILPDELLLNFINYLQYTRERFTSNPYSVVFWIRPELEKQLFDIAPDFHHWIFGTYDFSNLLYSDILISTKLDNISVSFVNKITNFLEKVIWQYENWYKVVSNNDQFLIEIMERANLHDFYVPSYCSSKEYIDQKILLDTLMERFLNDNSKNFLTLLGDFGTGKSSFSLHYYIYLSKKYIKDKNNERIPIFISLKDYVGKLSIEDFIVKEFFNIFNIEKYISIFNKLALDGKFVFFVDGFDEMASLSDQQLTEENLKELTKLTFEQALFMTKDCSKLHKANKVFLTCRSHYFLTEVQEQKILKADYTVLYRNYATKSNYEITRIKLKEFNDEQIKEYINKNTKDIEKTNEVLKIINDTYNLKELSERPLLLEMIVKTLPELKYKKEINAASLYKSYTDMWIERDDWRSHMKPEGKRAFMHDLAINIFQKGGDFSLHYTQLNSPDVKHLKNSYEQKEGDYYIYETTTCSFLNRDNDGNYKFIHKSFMEYFVAESFYLRTKKKQNRLIDPKDFNRQVSYFLKLIISSDKTELSSLDLSSLDLTSIDLSKGNLSSADLSNSDLSNSDLSYTDLKFSNLSNIKITSAHFCKTYVSMAKIDKIFSVVQPDHKQIEINIEYVQNNVFSKEPINILPDDLLRIIRNNKIDPKLRVKSGNALALVGDPRPEVTGINEMNFCLVPGGDFWMGKGEEIHLIKHLKKSYFIGRYPITNAQYSIFIESGGYSQGQYWKEAEKKGVWKEGKYKGRALPLKVNYPLNLPNHPVVNISLHEGIAFTRWLTEIWKEKGFIPNSWVVTLPTEAEWEKAARGGLQVPQNPIIIQANRIIKYINYKCKLDVNKEIKRIYTWGDNWDSNNINADETEIGITSSVGCFSSGISPYGCEDISGNVWECTRSIHKSYPYKPDDGREHLDDIQNITWITWRGGSCSDKKGYQHCASRGMRYPISEYRLDSFRCVVCPKSQISESSEICYYENRKGGDPGRACFLTQT